MANTVKNIGYKVCTFQRKLMNKKKKFKKICPTHCKKNHWLKSMRHWGTDSLCHSKCSY